MPFPPSPRVFFGKNPLFEVVCQLRFPTILRIDAEAPAAFQERIRGEFPHYSHSVVQPAGLPVGLPPQVVQLLGPLGASTHEFVSNDKTWKLSLTTEFLALTTSAYLEWSDFRRRLEGPLQALIDIYKPAFFQRIGLRYRDRIRRSELNLADVEWRDLLRPEVVGELADPSLAPHVQSALRELVITLSTDSGRVRILHGLDRDGDENTYVIDSDFFCDAQTPTGGAIDVLNGFNERAGNLFRWAILRRLHDAMEPRTPPG